MTGADAPVEPELPDEVLGRAPGRGRLTGRRVLVVGAGTRPSDDPQAPIGNGRAISVLAAREGATVVCVDRHEAAARETVRLIEADDPSLRGASGAQGGRAFPLAADELVADHVLSDATWAALAATYNVPQMIEICMLVGEYAMLAGTLNSLGVRIESGFPTPAWDET